MVVNYAFCCYIEWLISQYGCVENSINIQQLLFYYFFSPDRMTVAVTETGAMPTQNNSRDFVLSSWNDGIYRRTIFVVTSNDIS